MKECDPKKCTALKLKKLGLAKVVYTIRGLPRHSLVLYPFTELFISPADKNTILDHGLSAIDCSWNKITPITDSARLIMRRLPFLLAANPINFSMPYKLSTLEALAAALYISGFNEFSYLLLSKVKWGDTFLALNKELLTQYANTKNSLEIATIDAEYRKLYNM